MTLAQMLLFAVVTTLTTNLVERRGTERISTLRKIQRPSWRPRFTLGRQRRRTFISAGGLEAGGEQVLRVTEVHSRVGEKKQSSSQQKQPDGIGQGQHIFSSDDFASPESLAEFLTAQGIDIKGWGSGTSKDVHYLWQEIQDRESVLALVPEENIEGKSSQTEDSHRGVQLVRRVQVVRVQVRRRRSDSFILVEERQTLRDGRVRHRGTIMAEKIKAGETPVEAARRGLKEELNGIVVNEDDIESLRLLPRRESERRGSISYPGLESLYDISETSAVVPKLPTGLFSTREEQHGSSIKEIFWAWHDTRLGAVPRGKSKAKENKTAATEPSCGQMSMSSGTIAGVVNLRSFLLGSWSFERTFTNRRENTGSRMNGVATFVPAESLDTHYDEYSIAKKRHSMPYPCSFSHQLSMPDESSHRLEAGRESYDDATGGYGQERDEMWKMMGERGKEMSSSWLLYTEAGELSINGRGFNTTRKLAFDFPQGDTSAAVISFLDGPSKNNVFHSLNLTTGRWKADHRCDPDFYRGKFELVKNMGTSDEKSSNEAQKKMWEVTWHITGPHKDQTIKTVYTQPEF